MENKFTAGPWTAGGTKPYKGNEAWIFDNSTPEKLICFLGGNLDKPRPSMDESFYNAHLIAAAPDLAEAIDFALHIKDLWSAQQSGTVSADHEGEMQALALMEEKLTTALNKALNK